MAYVARLRFGSVMRFSISWLDATTAVGCVWASLLSVLMAANLSTGLGEVRKRLSTMSQDKRDKGQKGYQWRSSRGKGGDEGTTNRQRVGRAPGW